MAVGKRENVELRSMIEVNGSFFSTESELVSLKGIEWKEAREERNRVRPHRANDIKIEPGWCARYCCAVTWPTLLPNILLLSSPNRILWKLTRF